MTSIARLGKKIKVAKDVYLIQKLDVIEGVIDSEQKFNSIDKDGNINKFYPYNDARFICSKKTEYCYCDEFEAEELIEQYPELESMPQVKNQMSNESFYLVFDNKMDDKVEYLKIDNEKFLELMHLSNEIDEMYDMETWNDGQSFGYSDQYILTTIDTFDRMIEQLQNNEVDDVILTLQTACDNYDVQNNLDYKIEEQIENGNNEIIIDAEEINKNTNKEKNIEKEEEKSLDQIIEELNQLIGMDNIKKQINKLSSYLSFLDKIKTKELNINLNQPNLNMVFLGNPGTGKTTVARIISAILNKLGYANGKFKEVSAQDFIAGYVGQTALKTEKLLKEIHGGVLFIDEAYSLTIGDEDSSFGNEAIAVLLKEMEKNETIFIFSGYKKEMQKFIESNSGLKSRIGNNFDFNDYKVEELLQMFINKINKSNFILENNVLDEIKKILENITKEKDFGNGRYIDKLFDNIVVEHAYNTLNSNNSNELKTITINDIQKDNINQINYKKELTKTIGF